MKKYLITFRKLMEDGTNKKVEMVVEAKHKEHAREVFKQQVKYVPLNYRIQEVK